MPPSRRAALPLFCPALVAVALALLPAEAAAPPDGAPRLVEQLGSDEFAKREQATQALEAIGQAALPALRKAARSPDLEVRRRAEALLRKIEAVLYRELRTFPGGRKA